MSKKKKTILIIIGAVVLIALFLVLMYANKREDAGMQDVQEGSTALPFVDQGKDNGAAVEKLEAEVAVKQASPEEIEEANIKNLAKIFVERWGSWSTDGDFSNFESYGVPHSVLTEYGTPAVGFYGVTTKALSAKIEGKTGNSASVRVSYQKQETISCRDGACPVSAGNGEDADVSYGEAAVELIKEGEKWVITQINADVKAD